MEIPERRVADASLLALPPLAAGEVLAKDGKRACVRPPSPPPLKFGMMHKLFGCNDLRGRGSHVEGCTQADPFMLCDMVRLPKGAKPPFCAHPHCGAGVFTVVFQNAGAIRPWDNVQGTEARPLLPGGLYHCDTGSGCVHDEPLEPLASALPTLAPSFEDGGDAARAATEGLWSTQLWYNAMDAASPDAPLRPVSTAVRMPDEAAVVRDGGVAARVLAGAYGGARGFDAPRSVLLLHVRVDPGGAGALRGLPHDFNGFLWVIDGAVAANALDLAHGESGLCLLPPGGADLDLRNASSSEPAQVFVALGLPHREPHVKYVGYGGGFVHRTADLVEAAMAEYERDPIGYGRAAAASTVDTSHLKLVPGFQDDDGPSLERPAGVVARFRPAC